MSQLSQKQLAHIFDFCKKWDIHYVDLRMELVDHIATRIEEIQEEDPSLSFKEAFHRVYKSFGIFGLTDVAAEHQKIVNRRYWKQIGDEFRRWVRIPQVVATVALTLGLFFFLQSYSNLLSELWIALTVGFVIASIVMWVRMAQLSKRMNKESSMLMAGHRQMYWVGYFLFYTPWITTGSQFGRFSTFLETSPYGALIGTASAVFVLIFLLANWRISRLAESQVESLRERMQSYIVAE